MVLRDIQRQDTSCCNNWWHLDDNHRQCCVSRRLCLQGRRQGQDLRCKGVCAVLGLVCPPPFEGEQRKRERRRVRLTVNVMNARKAATNPRTVYYSLLSLWVYTNLIFTILSYTRPQVSRPPHSAVVFFINFLTTKRAALPSETPPFLQAVSRPNSATSTTPPASLPFLGSGYLVSPH